MVNRIKQALSQAQNDGVIKKSSVTQNADVSSVEKSSGAKTSEANDIPIVALRKKTLKKNHVFLGDEADNFAMAYKILRTQVYQKMRQNGWKTLGVTSSSHSEGKSLTALNLAFSLAKAVSTEVILLDFDLRRPSLDKKLGLDIEKGVGDYFAYDTPLADIAVRIAERLTVFPGLGGSNDASEILSSSKMHGFISKLKARHPDALFIFDLPPVLLVDDVLAFSPELDTTLVIAEEGRTKAEELSRTLELLQLTNLLGVVLNKSGEITSESYYY